MPAMSSSTDAHSFDVVDHVEDPEAPAVRELVVDAGRAYDPANTRL